MEPYDYQISCVNIDSRYQYRVLGVKWLTFHPRNVSNREGRKKTAVLAIISSLLLSTIVFIPQLLLCNRLRLFRRLSQSIGQNARDQEKNDHSLRVLHRWHVLCHISKNSRVFAVLYHYMRNFCNLIGLEQWYFSLI